MSDKKNEMVRCGADAILDIWNELCYEQITYYQAEALSCAVLEAISQAKDFTMTGPRLVLSFPDQSPSFAHGFACGQIWQRMSESDQPIEQTMDVENRDTIEAMAMAKGWDEQITDIGDGWIEVKLSNPSFKWEPE